jgi:hypothetical protein
VGCMRTLDMIVCFEETTTCRESPLSPNIFGYFDNQFQFRDLLLEAQLITQHRAGKTALWADAKLFQRHDLACIIDAVFEIVGFLQRPSFSGHETKVQPLMRRQITQRSEVSGAR